MGKLTEESEFGAKQFRTATVMMPGAVASQEFKAGAFKHMFENSGVEVVPKGRDTETLA